MVILKSKITSGVKGVHGNESQSRGRTDGRSSEFGSKTVINMLEYPRRTSCPKRSPSSRNLESETGPKT